MTSQLGLFRTTDPATSRQAAEYVGPHLSKLQRRVLEAYREHGPMSARQCERLPEFADCAPSTVRRRITTLHRLGLLVAAGTESVSGKTAATVYHLA